MIQYRWMEAEEVTKINVIDRSEQIRTHYTYSDGKLQSQNVDFDIPRWDSEGEGEYSVASQIRFCQGHLDRAGRMYGAFTNGNLLGIGILQPEIREGIAQLAYLHVSNGHRQEGIGGQIAEKLIDEAKKIGAKRMYVTATSSESAVGFYLSYGFHPVTEPIPELFELEPEDIHMMKEL